MLKTISLKVTHSYGILFLFSTLPPTRTHNESEVSFCIQLGQKPLPTCQHHTASVITAVNNCSMIGANAKLSFQLAQSGNIHLVLLCCWEQGSKRKSENQISPSHCLRPYSHLTWNPQIPQRGTSLWWTVVTEVHGTCFNAKGSLFPKGKRKMGLKSPAFHLF